MGTLTCSSRSSLILVLTFSFLSPFVPCIRAQDSKDPNENRVPRLRAGILYGRTGTAKGPSSYLEVNPSRWIGFCATVSRSTAYANQDGAAIRASDFTSGLCMTAHAPQIKGFLISPFAQIEYQVDRSRILYPFDDGTFYEENNQHERHLMTYGATIDRAIARNGPRWAMRVGKNFGDGPAANNAAGLYLVGGVIFPLDHPTELGRSFRKFAWWK